MRFFLGLCCLILVSSVTMAEDEVKPADHMFATSQEETPVLTGSHYCIFRGEKDVSAYNNHSYLARYANRYFSIWSCGLTGGSRTGQWTTPLA